jgi:hypothetical protein
VGKSPAIVNYSILFFFLSAIAFQSCSRSSCKEAIIATKLAQYEFNAAIDEVIHGASQEALEKEQAAYVKLDKARDEVREACRLPSED